MNGKLSFDAVVVGGGVIGLSVAHALGARSAKTAIVSPESAEGSASLAAGAMVDAFGEMSQLSSQEDIERLRIEVEAQRFYRDWIDELSEQAGLSIFHQSGHLHRKQSRRDLRRDQDAPDPGAVAGLR